MMLKNDKSLLITIETFESFNKLKRELSVKLDKSLTSNKLITFLMENYNKNN